SRRRHTRLVSDWSSDVCSSDLLNIQRTAAVLSQQFSGTLKPHGLSETQYNVLRILRGAGSAGLACQEIGERMIAHDPDITRLLRSEERRVGKERRTRGARCGLN